MQIYKLLSVLLEYPEQELLDHLPELPERLSECSDIDDAERVDRREDLARIAGQYGLLATGGSDYHGEQHFDRPTLGSVDLPAGVLQRFLQRLDQR